MKVKRVKLLEKVQTVSPALMGIGILADDTGTILLNAESISAFNSDIFIRTPSKSFSFLKETVVVPATVLSEILSTMKDDEIEIELAGKEIRIQGKRVKAGIISRSDNDSTIPSIKAHPIPCSEEFLEIVKVVAQSASTDLSKPELTNVHIKGNLIEACDGFQITRFEMSKKIESSGGCLLPLRALTSILPMKPTTMDLNPSKKEWALFMIENGTIIGIRKGSGTFPDLGPLLKEKKGESIVLSSKMKAGVERASSVLPKEKTDQFIEIEIKGPLVLMKAKGPFGWIRERFKTKNQSGLEASFLIDPRFLMTILETSPKITLQKTTVTIIGDNFVHKACLKSK